MDKDQVGRIGENIAAHYLQERGYAILERNWRVSHGPARLSGERCNRGELDVVAITGNTLVGVEVKTRSTERYGHPAAAVTPAKVSRLRRLLGQWLTEHRHRLPHISEIRLDAIAIVLSGQPQAGLSPEITHFRGIA